MAFLTAVKMGDQSFVLRALQPFEDRVSLNHHLHGMAELNKTISTLGQIVASAHLRSSGREGSASADELIAFGHKLKWKNKLLSVAKKCAQQVEKDWGIYAQAYDDGLFKLR